MKECIDILDRLIVISEILYKEIEYAETTIELKRINKIIDDVEDLKENIKKYSNNQYINNDFDSVEI